MRTIVIFMILAFTTSLVKGTGQPAKIYAVVVGVCHYKDASLNKLKYCENDAAEFVKFLKSPQAGSVPDENIISLSGPDATRRKIVNAVADLFGTRANENDMIIFYFSGHGSSGAGSGYLMPFEAEYTDPVATAVPMDQLYSIINSSPAKMKTVYIDACHAGYYPHSQGSKGSSSEMNSAISSAFANIIGKSKPGVMTILSSKSEEDSEESESFHSGLFTHYLLLGLRGQADKTPSDGHITAGELEDYLTENVKEASNYRQHPIVSGTFDSDFPLSITDLSLTLSAIMAKHDLKQPSQENDVTPVPVPSKPANELLSRGLAYDNFNTCYATATFINKLPFGVTIWSIEGPANLENKDEYIDQGDQFTTVKLEIGRCDNVEKILEQYISYTFHFRIEVDGKFQYATIRRTLQAGYNQYFVISSRNLKFSDKKN
jgi:hypothetical protein